MRARDIVLACCPPALWALSFALAKPALEHFPPIFMTSVAYAAAALILLPRSLRAKTPWRAMLTIAGLGGALQGILIFTGLRGLPASTAILVVQSQVPFAILSAWAICGEKLNVRRLSAMVIVLAGIGLIAGAPEAVHAFGSLALVVIGTLSWGVGQALIRAWGRDDGSTMIGSVTLYAAPQLALASLVLESGQLDAVRTATLLDWSAVLTLALGGFVVAYSIWYELVQRYRVDQVAPFALLMPLAGVVFGAVLFGERLSARAAIGGLVVLIGLAFILKEPAVRRKPSPAER
jgi:O-acetylserine/cysteine efflux transporter